MNSIDNKALRMLEHYVDEYKIFIDTCSLMFDKIEDFLSRLMPIVEKKGLHIFVPHKCQMELEKHAKNKSDLELSSKARKGLCLLKKYAAGISIREDKWESSGSFADNVFKTVFTMHRDKYNLLLITQDNNLAKEIKDLNKSKAIKGYKVEVKRINKYGFLSHYDWEENTGITINDATNEKRVDSFKLCTSITNIPADEITISSVPIEGSIVYTEDKSTIKIGAHIAGGGEGDVYETNTSYVAKIYKQKKLDKRKEEKIKRIIQKKLQYPGICFPISTLINKNGEFVGYLMPRAKGMEISKSIFLGKIMIAKKLPKWGKKDLVLLCITILEKISFLHSYNIILGDINGGNILIASPTEIYFVDVDSYQIEDIPCPVGVDQFTPKEILGKDFKTFLRSFGNEYYALATMLFKIMLPGKSPYAQQGGSDLIENIQKMDFSFPFEEKSNKRTPPGAWGYIWSHLSYKVKRAFYNTFAADGENSKESNRISTLEWLEIFQSYYYELTDGNMIKNDSMSGEIFPTRLKNSSLSNGNTDGLSGKTVKCKICGSSVDEKLTTKGICNSCLRAPAGNCKKCGKPLQITNYDIYLKNCNLPKLCKECNDASKITCKVCGAKVDEKTTEKGICQRCLNAYKIFICSKCGRDIRYYGRQEHLEHKVPPSRCDKCQVYTTKTCCDCGVKFEITVGEKEFYDKQGFDLPKRCKTCKQKQSLGIRNSSVTNFFGDLHASTHTTKHTVLSQHQTAKKQFASNKTKSTNTSTTKVKSQDTLIKKKDLAEKEIGRYFEIITNLANRNLGFFAKRSFKSMTASSKSKILRLIDSSCSKYGLENFIDVVHNAINNLHSAYLKDLDDFLKLIEDIVNTAKCL